MTDGADGYRTDIGYPVRYHPELNPLRARLAFLKAGLKPPAIATACELGFGQGLSIASHGAASAVQWHGTDINPDHAAFARRLAAAAGAEVGLHAQSFADFAARSDLPAFDFIGLHGVWSWISDANRSTIVRFVQRRLKPGGLLYLGYNALPGWESFIPVRRLLVEQAERDGGSGDISDRIDEALHVVERFLAVDPTLATPQILEHFSALKEEDRRYLAHEYFNRDWEPMSFAAVAHWLEPAGLTHACAADFGDHVDRLSLSAAQRKQLDENHDPVERETIRDAIARQRFRRDYWVKGAERLSAAPRAEALRGERVIAVKRLLELPFKLRAALALGESGPRDAAVTAILDMLGDRRAWSLGEIERALRPGDVPLDQIVDILILLVNDGLIEAAQDEQIAAQVRPRTDRLNAWLIEQARTDDEIRCLASPVTGGAVGVGRRELLFLSAMRLGKTRPEDWGDEAAKVLSTEEQPALAEAARTFADDGLPRLRALQAV